MARATYQCTALVGTSKAGVIKADAAGYYTVVLGALDFYNSAGAFYAYEPAKVLFDTSSCLQRRVANGALRGEYGHPKFVPGMTNRDFLMRIMDIDEKSTCVHIKEVWIDSDSVRNKDGSNVIAIMGRVKPSGPYGDKLAAQFENPDENVCFSIRSLTEDIVNEQGITVKTLREIVTWDYVNEPGISVANKYSIPTMEQLFARGFDTENLVAARDYMMRSGTGLESAALSNINNAIEAYAKPKFEAHKSGLIVPAKPTWLQW